MTDAVVQVLQSLNIQPVLVDVGASAEPPRIWQPIAKQSIYIGFDPDRREMHELPPGSFYKGYILNQAVTSEPDRSAIDFYLTRSPFCSSVLRPDQAALSDYLFADLFEVENQVSVPAIQLDEVLTRLSLPGIDWLKIDSQGTDLRLFKSLSADRGDRVLALDIEPGLIDAYQGEDLFIDAHRALTGSGFWLSNARLEGAVRMRRATLAHIATRAPQLPPDRISTAIRMTPGWIEARYLRTLDWLRAHESTQREYALLWAFALLDGQWGYALDLAVEWEHLFGTNEVSHMMQAEALARIRHSRRYWFVRARSLAPTRLKRWLRKIIGTQQP